MNVCLLALWSDSLTYTIAKALAFTGHRVMVWIADAQRDRSSKWSLSARIASIPGVTLVNQQDTHPLPEFPRLVVQGHPLLLQFRPTLDLLASKAQSITAISAGDRNRPPPQALRLQWSEWSWYGRWWFKVTRVAYKDGYYPTDLWGLFKSRSVVGFDPHSNFLSDPVLFEALHACDWEVDTCRPYLVNFLGSRDPECRGRILDSIESRFIAADGKEHEPRVGKRMRWLTYSDTQPAALSGLEFLRVLTDSDFTLAPRGYSLITHRPVEALLRGSIPVLDAQELGLYDLNLRDGVNCIAVIAGDWAGALDRILAMGEQEIRAMRRNIADLLLDRVKYPALAREISRRLAVQEG